MPRRMASCRAPPIPSPWQWKPNSGRMSNPRDDCGRVGDRKAPEFGRYVAGERAAGPLQMPTENIDFASKPLRVFLSHARAMSERLKLPSPLCLQKNGHSHIQLRAKSSSNIGSSEQGTSFPRSQCRSWTFPSLLALACSPGLKSYGFGRAARNYKPDMSKNKFRKRRKIAFAKFRREIFIWMLVHGQLCGAGKEGKRAIYEPS